jgi:magnesium transporter
MRITVFDATQNMPTSTDVPAADLPAILQRATASSTMTIWVDMCGPTDEEVQVLEQVFKFHPLTIEDARNHHQRPNIHEYADYYFAILNPLAFEHRRMFFREVDVFVGKTYFVTVRTQLDRMSEEMVDGILAKLRSQQTTSVMVNPAYLMYLLSSAVLQSYFPVVDKIGYELDELEEAILDRPHQQLLNRVFKLKRDLMELWRITGQQRDMFSLMTNRDLFMSSKTLRYYFRDAYDHLLRINDMISTYRDVITGLMDLYMSVVSNRLNVIVQRFTIVTVVIGIFTVISGFYGMNFDANWPPSRATWGVPLVLAAMIALSSIFLVYLKRRELL